MRLIQRVVVRTTVSQRGGGRREVASPSLRMSAATTIEHLAPELLTHVKFLAQRPFVHYEPLPRRDVGPSVKDNEDVLWKPMVARRCELGISARRPGMKDGAASTSFVT